MPTDSESDLQLEIGHVLLIDIVGYSKLLITEQRERLQALNEIVRAAGTKGCAAADVPAAGVGSSDWFGSFFIFDLGY